MSTDPKICVVGLGYVGLPVAMAFADRFPETIGFDIDENRVKQLTDGVDRTGETSKKELANSSLRFTCDIDKIKDCNFYIIAVPTPVDNANIPNLNPIISASETVGKVLKIGDTVIYESTVYPGVTEDICSKILAQISGLKAFTDFKLGYSPERINPGDRNQTIKKITKIVSGQDSETLDKISILYGSVIEAGIFKASSIKVAEAAKVIENTQRDLNIALVNELAIIFDRMGINTKDVLDAASTKWNFLRFKPGLVGGHCIGVDPYYLTYKAEELGYHPQVILAGRRINDSMASFVAQKCVKLMLNRNLDINIARVGILGLSFKENVSDTRNSKVPDILTELKEYGINALVFDPIASAHDALLEYNIKMNREDELSNLDVLILAVPHDVLMIEGADRVISKVKLDGLIIDIKSALDRDALPKKIGYWSL